mmetsp:Transcript_11192/g.35047  ORF Transcript_11192/g.35047 Transcript_11192/m.35047 type:complete len:137 (+) Transcript_11192:90-500(+)
MAEKLIDGSGSGSTLMSTSDPELSSVTSSDVESAEQSSCRWISTSSGSGPGADTGPPASFERARRTTLEWWWEWEKVNVLSDPYEDERHPDHELSDGDGTDGEEGEAIARQRVYEERLRRARALRCRVPGPRKVSL